jgi:hypothetical protein
VRTWASSIASCGFRLGETFWIDDGSSGWSLDPEKGWELELGEGLEGHIDGQELATLPAVGTTDVERRANRALVWIEQSQFAVDPTIAMLFLFFALEAILGNSSEGLKGPRLALRRAVLGAATADQFTHPTSTLLLYDVVRSNAVTARRSRPSRIPT